MHATDENMDNNRILCRDSRENIKIMNRGKGKFTAILDMME